MTQMTQIKYQWEQLITDKFPLVIFCWTKKVLKNIKAIFPSVFIHSNFSSSVPFVSSVSKNKEWRSRSC